VGHDLLHKLPSAAVEIERERKRCVTLSVAVIVIVDERSVSVEHLWNDADREN